MIPRVFINELLARADIIDLIDARVPLKKRGNSYLACCPFHNEKTPSFTASSVKQFYYCFGCGANGNAITFLMEYDRLDFVGAVETLANHLGMDVPKQLNVPQKGQVQQDLYQLLEKVSQYYQLQLRQHQTAIAYLKGRGLSGQIAKDFGIGYAPSGWDHLLKYLGNSTEVQSQLLTTGMLIKKDEGGCYDRFRERIMFPIRDQRGRVIGFGGRIIGEGTPKYLNSPETAIFHKGRELYGLYEARKAQRELSCVLVVEGYMDVVALVQHGISNVVATLGTATSVEHLQRLARCTSEIVFCFDGDQAGKNAAWRALEITLPVLQDGLQVRFMFLPQGEDPDSLVRKEGQEGFISRLAEASALTDFFFSNLCAQVNLAKMDGRARLAKLALPLIQQVQGGVFQHMLLEKLSQIVRVESAKLKELAAIPPATKNGSPKSLLKHVSSQSPMRVAIALLLQYPLLAKTVDSNHPIMTLRLPGGELLQQIFEILQQSPDLSSGALLEHWRDRKEASLLAKLAAWDHPIPEDGIAAEFLGALNRLLTQNKERQVEDLLLKAQQHGLSQPERLALQQLIAESKS